MQIEKILFSRIKILLLECIKTYSHSSFCNANATRYVHKGKVKSTFLGMFTKLRRATISFVILVCLSVQTEQFGSQGTDFHKIRYLGIHLKSVENIQVSLKSDIY